MKAAATCPGVKVLTIALCGNPNCGKTTLFNALTGQKQSVGNWAGVTVEQKTGRLRIAQQETILVDLPGVYSLSPYSLEEKITSQFLLEEKPDVILNIVDGVNLQRNLYLTLQLMETGIPIVVAVNMMDEVRAMGGCIDCSILSKRLQVPILPVSARRREGVDALLQALCRVKASIPYSADETPWGYDSDTQNALNALCAVIADEAPHLPVLFFAAKLLEGDTQAFTQLALSAFAATSVDAVKRRYEATVGGDGAALMADARYNRIQRLMQGTYTKGTNWTQWIDSIVTNRICAIPIFAGVVFIMFSITFGPVSRVLKEWIGMGMAYLSLAMRGLLDAVSAPLWTYGLMLDAIIGGVGGVVLFLPQMLLLFLSLSLLEDSGYMARAAFIMDHMLHRVGLSGKSFIPMLMGFGCTTPAVMAARTMDNERDRCMTILLIPFMSCGARLPIYALFSGVFFPGQEHLIVFAMYLLGLMVAILCGLLLRKTILDGPDAPFVMELPPYRMPILREVLVNLWVKCKNFLCKAGTVIFSVNVFIWVLQRFTPALTLASDASQSVFAYLGRCIAPVLRPLGFGTWQAADALLTGLAAKEAVVGTLGVLYAQGNPDALGMAVSTAFTPLSALSFMVFCLLYPPCVSAFVSICRETNSLKWALGGAVLQTGVAYLVSFLVYSFGLYWYH